MPFRIAVYCQKKAIAAKNIAASMRLTAITPGSLEPGTVQKAVAGKLTKHAAVAKDEAAEKGVSSLAPGGRNREGRQGMLPRKKNQVENAEQEKDKLLKALHRRVSVRKASILRYTHICISAPSSRYWSRTSPG